MRTNLGVLGWPLGVLLAGLVTGCASSPYAQLTSAIERGNTKRVDAVLAKNNWSACRGLLTASFRNSPAIVKYLLDESRPGGYASPNCTSRVESALTLAASGGYLEIVDILLDKGADPNRKIQEGNYAGWTATDIALAKDHVAVVARLEDAGGARTLHHQVIQAKRDEITRARAETEAMLAESRRAVLDGISAGLSGRPLNGPSSQVPSGTSASATYSSNRYSGCIEIGPIGGGLRNGEFKTRDLRNRCAEQLYVILCDNSPSSSNWRCSPPNRVSEEWEHFDVSPGSKTIPPLLQPIYAVCLAGDFWDMDAQLCKVNPHANRDPSRVPRGTR